MTRDELQERIEDILDGVVDDAYRDDHESVHEIADRILALLPPQPKLEWQVDEDLCIGSVCLGYVRELGDWWFGFDWHSKQICGRETKQEARAAVEAAVRKALRWGQ